MKKVILFLFMCISVYAQYIPIDSVRRQDANGVPLLLGQTVTVRGVVTMSQELGSPLVYFQDPTGGMVGYDNTFWTNTNNGDSVQVTGVVTQFSGLTELTPVSNSQVLATNIPYTARVVTCGDVRLNGELYEGQLIRINGVTAVHTTSGANATVWNTSGSGTNYRILVGNDSVEIRIFSSTNIANSPVPPFPFDVIALASQFDSSPPHNSGYQILPRSLSDFIVQGGSGPLLSSITYTNIQPTSVTINWQSSTSSNSKVRWQLADSNYQVIAYTDSTSNAANVTNHSVILSGLQAGRIYYYNVSSTDGNGTTTSPMQYFCTQSNSAGTINVYFNRSVDTTLNSGEIAQGNVNFQTKLLQRINNAQYSIDMALYSLNDLTQVRDALINAKVRGVKIRFVYDSRTNQALVDELVAAGIPMIKRPNSSGLMHNKFFVFDYRYNSSHTNCWVWTGSTNLTNQQLYSDANNVIEFQDRTMAAVYTREFEEMWGSAADLPIVSRSKFGSAKSDNTPKKLNVSGTPVEIYFTPGDNTSNQLQSLINTQYDYDCYFSILVFTDYNIANRMKARYNPSAGRFVKGVFDRDTTGGVFREMSGYGPFAWNPAADVVRDLAEPYDLHHKYLIIDPLHTSSNPVVETGSYNYSNAANNSNDENAVFVYSARVANLYVQEWYKRYKVSGGTAVIGLEQISAEVPEAFELKQNYPNPFNPNTSIEYKVAKQSSIMLKVFDITGKEVQVLVNENQQAGIYRVNMKALNMASGVYFYVLESDGLRIDTKKMVLVK
ncbi:MAG: peptidase S8/S53 subtilisin kexin sedolisin [Chlorobi bacterium OLB5]|nr:MAG: peptidase S8/S53 subtilisin kexin sedolisin [Chlorobi bacterium OLB5]